jgi:glutamate synthase domain-containing protein 2
MRKQFLVFAVSSIAAVILCGVFYAPTAYWAFGILAPLLGIGFRDFFQTKHTIRRNFPILGNFRYLLESIRPEINQYFVESNSEGMPFSREERSVVYQRAKRDLDTLPFGTRKNVYEVGYEWLTHSIMASHVNAKDLRVIIGGPQCKQPYSASILNISAMSFGSLSQNAVLALNGGAKDGNFAHNTGEGGLSPYHLEHGGDVIWQIGTGYFSARTLDGKFSESEFQKRAVLPQVKMIEVKISQGAKPGHGGILPAAKVTKEISEIRGVPMGQDVLSPPSHTAFSTPKEMMHFIGDLRELSGGKPVGFKICIGKRREFLAILKAMESTGILPDYISIDGGEGGTGAAPVEFSNHVGMPGIEGLIFAHNALVGFGLRDKIRVLTAGKVTTGFGLIKRLALGADAVYSARAFMMALGCIQALQCNSNVCPTGIATQDPDLTEGLVVHHKRKRVTTFHKETMESVAHLIGAMGVNSTSELRPWHIMRRVSSTEVKHFGDIFHYLKSGELLKAPVPAAYARAMELATPDTFHAKDEGASVHSFGA